MSRRNLLAIYGRCANGAWLLHAAHLHHSTSIMKLYFLTPSILLVAAFASGTPSSKEEFNIALDKIKSIQSKIESNRSAARRDHDTILFSCLNNATNQVYATTKQLEGKYYNPSTQDADIAANVLTHVQQIESEANNCLGSTSIFQLNKTQTSYSINSDISNVDLALPAYVLFIDPPNCASCFR